MFRVRKDKKIAEDNRKTLDLLHRETVETRFPINAWTGDVAGLRSLKRAWVQYYIDNADILLEYYRQGTRQVSLARNFFGGTPAAGTTTAPRKDQLLEEFRIRNDIGFTAKDKADDPRCEACNKPIHDAACTHCGTDNGLWVVPEHNWKERNDKNNFNYRRINHWNELMSQLLTRQSKEIPEELMRRVEAELRKQRVKDDVDYEVIRMILKKLGYTDYYDHAMLIIARITGKTPMAPSEETIETLNNMFNEAQGVWHLYKPDDRRNILTYKFLFYKLFELLELDEFKKYCPLLKTREKLVEYDKIWRNICAHLRWEFYPTV